MNSRGGEWGGCDYIDRCFGLRSLPQIKFKKLVARQPSCHARGAVLKYMNVCYAYTAHLNLVEYMIIFADILSRFGTFVAAFRTLCG